jgi:hypothetical protein
VSFYGTGLRRVHPDLQQRWPEFAVLRLSYAVGGFCFLGLTLPTEEGVVYDDMYVDLPVVVFHSHALEVWAVRFFNIVHWQSETQ